MIVSEMLFNSLINHINDPIRTQKTKILGGDNSFEGLKILIINF